MDIFIYLYIDQCVNRSKCIYRILNDKNNILIERTMVVTGILVIYLERKQSPTLYYTQN